MRVMVLISILCMCLMFSGCVYSSMNLMSAQGKDIMILGMEGFIHVQDASVRIYRTQDSRSHKNDDNTFASRANFIENADAANVAIGAPLTALPPTTATSASVTTPMGSTTTTTTPVITGTGVVAIGSGS